MNDNRLDPSTERLVIREIVRFANLKVWYYVLGSFIIGAAAAFLVAGYFYGELVKLCL